MTPLIMPPHDGASRISENTMPERLRPVGQRRVMQVMRARPHVREDQRPEVDDRQPIRVDRPARLLRHEVVHHPEEAGGQEEADRVVAVPPLHHRVLDAGVRRIRLHRPERDRHLGAVDDVQQRDRSGCTRRRTSWRRRCAASCAWMIVPKNTIAYVTQTSGDQDVDRPFELGVFLGRREAERQRDRRQHDDRLPAPERERRERVAEEAHLARALDDVIGRREQRASRRTRRSPRSCAAGAAARRRATGCRTLRSGQSSCAAMMTPTSMPTIPQTTVMIANWRTTL